MKNSQKLAMMAALNLISIMLLACQSVQYKEIKQNEAVKQNKISKEFEAINFVYKSYPVSVDYSRSLSEMVMAGRYDLMNDSEVTVKEISAATKGKVNVDLYLIHLDRVATDEEVISNLDRLGFQPAKIEHLLAFGAKYPSSQLKFPIVALGSPMTDQLGRQYVNYLDRIDDIYQWELPKRCLYLFSESRFGNNWSETCRFLAVRK